MSISEKKEVVESSREKWNDLSAEIKSFNLRVKKFYKRMRLDSVGIA